MNTVLSVLGYDNVKSAPINPKVREELDYLDREVRFLELSICVTYPEIWRCASPALTSKLRDM
jgi:hypothetical protein